MMSQPTFRPQSQPALVRPKTTAATADAAATFGLLGPLLVTDPEGTPVRLPAAKQRTILAALLLSANTTVSADQLADALWGAIPPPTAAAAVRTYVTRLRRALGAAGSRLVSRTAGYAIEIQQPGEFDVAEMEELRATAQRATDTGDWNRAAWLLGKAASLWRGASLEDIPSPTLQGTEGQWLSELRTEITIARIDAELHVGKATYLVNELRRLATEHPLREHVQAQLMLAYFRSGRQAEALSVYQAVRGTLVSELGVEPGPELRTLHQLILTGSPALEGSQWPNALRLA